MSTDSGNDDGFDVFISHASEDKDSVVRPLAGELQALGLEVWYDEFELTLGDSLRESIDEGLKTSNFGVVVLSEQFFGKDWSEYELNGLVQRQMAEDKVILPLWYDVSHADIVDYSPSLADLKAEPIDTDNIQDRASEIYRIVQNSDPGDAEEEWGDDSGDGSTSTPSFESVDIRFEGQLNLDIGDQITLETWRNHNAPKLAELEAVEVRDDRDVSFTSETKGTTMSIATIEDQPLTGMVSDIESIRSGQTRFTMRIQESRLDELSDDPDDYRALI